METLIIKPRNKKELSFLRQFLELANMSYVIDKSEKTGEIKNPMLIKRIEKARKNIERNTVVVNPDDIWQSIM